MFGNDTYSVQTVRSWLREFRGGRDRFHDKECSGRPVSVRTEENVEAVLDAVTQNKKQRIMDIALTVQLSHSSVQRILRGNLNFRKKAAKFVPHLLTDRNRQVWMQCTQDMLDWIHDERGLLSRVITGDESYIHLYNPGSKECTKEWLDKDEPRPQKPLRGWGTRHSKCMVIVFFDHKGVVYREFVRDQTITSAVYIQVLDRLLTAIQHRRTQLWRSGLFVLHDDNMPAHQAEPTQTWLGRKHIRQLEHPPYSPDLAPADFWLFPTLKKKFRNIRFPDLEHS